jgi:hypothetical protein
MQADFWRISRQSSLAADLTCYVIKLQFLQFDGSNCRKKAKKKLPKQLFSVILRMALCVSYANELHLSAGQNQR